MLNEIKQFVLDKTAENDKRIGDLFRMQQRTAYMTGLRDVAGQAALYGAELSLLRNESG